MAHRQGAIISFEHIHTDPVCTIIQLAIIRLVGNTVFTNTTVPLPG